jgi:hypothetical protein
MAVLFLPEHGSAACFWLPSKQWLKVANQVLKLTTDHRARKIADQHQINWPEILPLTAIAKSRDKKIRRFQEQQLEQGYK